MPNYPYTFQLPPLNVQDIPNDGVAGEFLGINGSGVLDWLTAGGGGTGDMLKADNLSGLASYPTARTNLGLGTGDSPTFANLTLTSPSLSSSAPVTISQTWNAVGQTFKALVVNAAGTSDANSASGSLLADFQVGGVSKAWVTKQGGYRASNGQFVSGNGIGFAGGLNTGFYSVGGEQIYVAANNNVPIEFRSTSIVVNSAAIFGFGTVGVGADTILVRDSASGNTLALRNGAAAQTFRVYNTFPGTGNNEFASLNWVDQPNEFQITTSIAGTGTVRALCLRSAANINFRIGGAPGTLVWQVTAAGNFISGSDNNYDIGASGANRPRNVYVGTNVVLGTNASSILTINNAGLKFENRFIISESGADGVLGFYNSAASGFNRLQFGGVTASFPAIKRNGAGLDIVLANDSGFAAVQDLYRRFGAGTPEGVVTAPIGAVYHNTTGGATTSFYVKESGTGNTGWVGK